MAQQFHPVDAQDLEPLMAQQFIRQPIQEEEYLSEEYEDLTTDDEAEE